MSRSIRNFLLILAAALYPFLPFTYSLFPETPIWHGHKVWWYVGWDAAIWTISVCAMPWVTAIIAFMAIPVKKLKALSFFLIVCIYSSGLQFWNAVYPREMFNEFGIIMDFAIGTLIVSVVIILKMRKNPSEREKKEQLLKAIDQLTEEDLPQLLVCFMELESTTGELKDPKNATNWKVALKRDVETGKLGTQSMLEKFERVKMANS